MKKLKDILKIIFLTLAILTMAVSLFGRANAEGMSTQDRNYIHSYFGDDFSDVQWSAIDSAMDSCPYFIIMPELNGDSAYLYLAPYGSELCYDYYQENGNIRCTGITDIQIIPWLDSDISGNQFDFGSSYGRLIPYSLGNVEYNSDRGIYGYYLFSTQFYTTAFLGYRVDISGRDYSDSGWNCYWYYGAVHGIADSGFQAAAYRMNVDLDNIICNYNSCIIQGEYSHTLYFEKNVVYENPVNDNIQVYKSLDNNGLPVLNVHWDKTPFPDTGSWNYGGFANVDITFDLDGTSTVISIDTDTYPQLFSNYDQGSFYIPYSVAQKVARLVTGYNDITELSVTHVDVSMKGYLSGTSSVNLSTYTMSTDVVPALVFKGVDNSIPDFDDDTPALMTEDDVSINVSQYNQYVNTLNSYYTADGLWQLSDSFTNDTNSEVLHLYIYQDVASDFQRGYANDSFRWDPNDVGSESIMQYLYDNAFTNEYDIIVFHVYIMYGTDISPNYELAGYLTHYSNRYYLRLLNRQAVNISDLFRVNNEYLYGMYTYLFSGIDQLNGNMISYFQADLGKTNSVLSYLSSLNAGLNTFSLNFINVSAKTHNYLDSILTAIGNIDSGSTDLSGVLAKMDVISDDIADIPNALRSDLIYLFRPTYNSYEVSFETYKNNIGILALPFDSTKLVLETVDDNYSSDLSITVPEIKFMNSTLYPGTEFHFNPWSLFDDQKLTSEHDPTGDGFLMGLRYFISYFAIILSVYVTYAHIFRRHETTD